MVAIDKVELRTQLTVDMVRAGVVPDGFWLVEQVEDREHLIAGAQGCSDELVQVPGPQGYRE